MRRKLSQALFVPLAAIGIVAGAAEAIALDADDALSLAQRQVSEVAAAETLLRGELIAKPREGLAPERRIALGELALGARDYERAIDTFNQVAELYRQGKVSRNSHADALFLLGQSYFESGQLLSAWRQYSALLEVAEQSAYTSYAGRGLARLVDVAVQTDRRASLAEVQVRVDRIRLSDPSGSFDYARGKLSFARGDFARARTTLASVPPNSEYYPQAQYVLGAILLRQALPGEPAQATAQARKAGALTPKRLLPAIEQFRKVTLLAVRTAPQRQVVDTAHLAVGRLFYESGAFLQAAEAYIQVERDSPVYFDMLFELAWVYVRVGDYSRAERAMELLSATAPNTLHVADGALLRADLMLRSGRYQQALLAYEAVREKFGPPSLTLQAILSEAREPAVYYERLVEEGMAVSGATKLPEFVLDWVKEEARGDRVFAVIDDVTQSRRLQRRATGLASKLDAVLDAPSRAQAFPKLEAALQKAVGLTNQLMLTRRAIALGVEDVEDLSYSGELGQIRAERRSLMATVGRLPVLSSEFATRREKSSFEWSRLSQALQRVTLEANQLQAVINGLERVLEEGSLYGVTRNPKLRSNFRAEVTANQRDLEVYRVRIGEYRKEVEKGRIQVGLGDRRFQNETQTRKRFRALQDREMVLLTEQQGVDLEVRDYLRSLASTMTILRDLESRLQKVHQGLEAQVARGAAELKAKVRKESDKLLGYTRALNALDQHGRHLLGEVALANFSQVNERLKKIVLRADVGMVQQAWENREEQRRDLRGLQRKRARAAQSVETEMQEVLDVEVEGGAE